MTLRRYDTQAIHDLIDRSRRSVAADVDVAYLCDALDHYHQAYSDAYKHEQALRNAVRSVHLALARMTVALDQLEEDA